MSQVLTDEREGDLIVSWDETLKRLDILSKMIAELMTLKQMYHLLSDHNGNNRQSFTQKCKFCVVTRRIQRCVTGDMCVWQYIALNKCKKIQMVSLSGNL